MSSTTTTTTTDEQSIKDRLHRLNNIYDEELDNSEIVLRNVGGEPYRYQLKIKPEQENTHPRINRFSDLGEEWTKEEIKAFIDGLEIAKIDRISEVSQRQQRNKNASD